MSITALTCTQTALTLAKQLDVASLEVWLTSANTQPGCSIQMILCFKSREKEQVTMYFDSFIIGIFAGLMLFYKIGICV